MGKSILEKVIGHFQEFVQQTLRQTPDQDYQEFLDQFTPSTAADGNIHYLDDQGNVVAIRYQDGTVVVDPELIEVALVSHDPDAGEIPPDECPPSPCPKELVGEQKSYLSDPNHDPILEVCRMPTEDADAIQRQAERFNDHAPVAKSKAKKSNEQKAARPAEDKPPDKPRTDESGIEVQTCSKELKSEEKISDNSSIEEGAEAVDSPKACGIMVLEEQADSTQIEPLFLSMNESSSFTFSAHLCFEIPMPYDRDDVESTFDAGRGQKGIGLDSQSQIQDGALAMVAGRVDVDQNDGTAPLDDRCVAVLVSSGLPKEDGGIGHGDGRLEYMKRGVFGVYGEGKSDRHPGSTSPFCASRTSDGGLASGRGKGLRERLGATLQASDDLLTAYETSPLGGQPHMLSFAALAIPGHNSPDDLRIASRVEHPESRGDQRDNLDREQQEQRDGSSSDGSDEADEDDASYLA